MTVINTYTIAVDFEISLLKIEKKYKKSWQDNQVWNLI
ncbi:hypothetical protein DYY67_0211 [Candidatus Nitrosotalea sp. TS]|nr:hypothetical protein [Candidatus Nitrosotalea sp. TS]